MTEEKTQSAIEFDNIELLPNVPRHDRERFHDETARTIAYTLIGVLSASFVFQLLSVGWFADDNRIAAVKSLYDVWLPVISGLTGSAVTYYFAKGKG